MQQLREEYLQRTDGDYAAAAVELAYDLMLGDPGEFKAGYTLENAVIAAEEVFPAMSRFDIEEGLGRKTAA